MQKVLRISIFILYTVLSVGVHVHVHACCCCVSLRFSLFGEETSCCDGRESKGCCPADCGTDQHLEIRLEQDHLAAELMVFRKNKTEMWRGLPAVALFRSGLCESAAAAPRATQQESPKKRRYVLYGARLTYG